MARDISSYRRPREHIITLAEQQFTVYDRQGMDAWQDQAPAADLIARHATLAPGDRILVGPSGHGGLAAWAASIAGANNVTCVDSSQIAAAVSRLTLDANGYEAAQVRMGVPRQEDAPYDAYLMLLPKGRDLARLWLLNGALAVRPGGSILLAGPNRGGIQSVARDAAMPLGSGHLMSYRASNRVFHYTRPADLDDAIPPPFDAPGIVNGTFSSYLLNHAGRSFTICTRPGVFSRDGLDEGTRMLLDVLSVRTDERALDLGCGAGVLGMMIAVGAPEGHVTLVDVDSLALESAQETLERNGIRNAAVIAGDGLESVSGRFTLIASNPPFHSGHHVDLAMTTAFIHESYDALEPGGRLVVVANRFLAYEHLFRERFGNVDILDRTSQYQVLQAVRSGGMSSSSP
jgi:16S rRNA (guanine1207-N2)-methyltransferase